MNKHHEELAIQYVLFNDVQSELKRSFDIVESTWQDKKELPCLSEINQWEQEVINRIRQIATKARTTVNELITKNMGEIHQRLDQLAFDIQQRQREGNYLDNDITGVENQLEKLNNAIKHIDGNIRVHYTMTNNVNWNSLMYVTTEQILPETRPNLSEFYSEQGDHEENLWTNFRKLIKTKHTNYIYKNRQSSFKRNTSSLYEPIVLTSFDSTPTSFSQQDTFESTKFDGPQLDTPSNDESINQINVPSINHNQLFPQASDA